MDFTHFIFHKVV